MCKWELLLLIVFNHLTYRISDKFIHSANFRRFKRYPQVHGVEQCSLKNVFHSEPQNASLLGNRIIEDLFRIS